MRYQRQGIADVITKPVCQSRVYDQTGIHGVIDMVFISSCCHWERKPVSAMQSHTPVCALVLVTVGLLPSCCFFIEQGWPDSSYRESEDHLNGIEQTASCCKVSFCGFWGSKCQKSSGSSCEVGESGHLLSVSCLSVFFFYWIALFRYLRIFLYLLSNHYSFFSPNFFIFHFFCSCFYAELSFYLAAWIK